MSCHAKPSSSCQSVATIEGGIGRNWILCQDLFGMHGVKLKQLHVKLANLGCNRAIVARNHGIVRCVVERLRVITIHKPALLVADICGRGGLAERSFGVCVDKSLRVYSEVIGVSTEQQEDLLPMRTGTLWNWPAWIRASGYVCGE